MDEYTLPFNKSRVIKGQIITMTVMKRFNGGSRNEYWGKVDSSEREYYEYYHTDLLLVFLNTAEAFINLESL